MGPLISSDRYEWIKLLGSGGFGSVWLARDNALDDLVAIKVLAADKAREADMRARFVREARLLRRVRSDRVVTVHDIGELADETPYFVMAYADGGTLADRLDDRPLPAATAVNIAVQTARAVAVLHGQGVVHRDIKPCNILFCGAGAAPERLLIGDLGLAVDASVSQASLIGGTPAYMAPEQVRGADAGPWSDVYSLGVLTHRLLTGELPTNASVSRPDLGQKVKRVLIRALAADPDRRQRTAAEFADQLTAAVGGSVLDDRSTAVRPVRAIDPAARPWYRPLVLAAALVAATSFLARDAYPPSSVESGMGTGAVGLPASTKPSSAGTVGTAASANQGALSGPGADRAPRSGVLPVRGIERTTPTAITDSWASNGSPTASFRVPARSLAVVTSAAQGGHGAVIRCAVANSDVTLGWIQLAEVESSRSNIWVHYWFNSSDTEVSLTVSSTFTAQGYNPWTVQEVEVLTGVADPALARPKVTTFVDQVLPTRAVRATAESRVMMHFIAHEAAGGVRSTAVGSAVNKNPPSVGFAASAKVTAGVIFRTSNESAAGPVTIGAAQPASANATGVVVEYPPAT